MTVDWVGLAGFVVAVGGLLTVVFKGVADLRREVRENKAESDSKHSDNTAAIAENAKAIAVQQVETTSSNGQKSE